MQLFCPSCQSAYSGATRCPRCDVLLLLPQEAAALAERPREVVAEERLRPTVGGRLVVGVLAALGLYLGLRKVAIGVLALTGGGEEWWETQAGLVAVFGFQAAAVAVGGLIAGAARARSFAVGGAVGGACGGLFLAAEVYAGTPANSLVLYLQPPLLALAGGAAAAVAGRVWPAAPDVLIPEALVKTGLSSSRLLNPDADGPAAERERPTAWARVLLAAVLMAAGVGFADQARVAMQKHSGGRLKVQSIFQAQFVSWQIATFAVLAAAGLAGAGTGAGVRHGLYAGFLGGLGAVGVTAARGGPAPPQIVYLLDQLSMVSDSAVAPHAVIALVMSLTLAGLVGGWLGGKLLLPLAPAGMRRRKLIGGD
jgi:hypothetical protein